MSFDRNQELQQMREQFPSLVLGVDAIDKDHAHLLQLIGELEALNKQTHVDLSLVWHVLAGIQEYTRYHFAREEGLMMAIKYEFTREHKAEHATLCDEINGYAERFRAGIADLPELTQFMERWLIRHVAGSDTLLVKSLRKAESQLLR
jgi:hemerythrin